MTTAGKTAGFALLILFLSSVVWAAVYYANRPVAPATPANNPPAPKATADKQTATTPLVWTNGTPTVDLTAKPALPAQNDAPQP